MQVPSWRWVLLFLVLAGLVTAVILLASDEQKWEHVVVGVIAVAAGVGILAHYYALLPLRAMRICYADPNATATEHHLAYITKPEMVILRLPTTQGGHNATGKSIPGVSGTQGVPCFAEPPVQRLARRIVGKVMTPSQPIPDRNPDHAGGCRCSNCQFWARFPTGEFDVEWTPMWREDDDDLLYGEDRDLLYFYRDKDALTHYSIPGTAITAAPPNGGTPNCHYMSFDNNAKTVVKFGDYVNLHRGGDGVLPL